MNTKFYKSCGIIITTMATDADLKRCSVCRGRGGVALDDGGFKTCPRCGGEGQVKKPFHEKLSREERQAMGGAGGLLFGAAVGGPVGAVVGGILGAAIASDQAEERKGRIKVE